MKLSCQGLRLVWIAFLGFGACIVSAQQDLSLSNYLATHPWDASKSGSLIVVDPDHTYTKKKGSSLLDFERKEATVGRLSAFVPTEMVLIDDSLADAPNLYDGLPTYAKVLYFASTLTSDQLKLACSEGIGLSSLQGEQVKVFKSILPSTLDWATYTVGQNGNLATKVDGGTVPSDQMDQVKLKLQSTLGFYLNLANTAASTYANTSGWNGRPGDRVTIHREDFDDKNFGVDFRKTVPNSPKASQLNTSDSRFDVLVSLSGVSTIQQLVRAVSVSTGVEILADIRVSGLSVKTVGSAVRAGDLLKAIALCVTGTYRKIDSAYVLTSDLVGLGARALKLAAWRDDVQKELDNRVGMWRRLLAKSGAITKIGFDPNDPFAPDGQSRGAVNNDKETPTSALTPVMRDFINQMATRDPTTPLKTDSVKAVSEVKYGFVLPNGQVLRPDGQGFGPAFLFVAVSAPKPEAELKVDAFPPGAAGRLRLVLRGENSADVVAATVQARTHGFTELWLETHSRDALLAALKEGLKIKLLVRPWKAPTAVKASFVDRNVLLDTAIQLGKRRANELEWQRFQDFYGRSATEAPTLYDMDSPLDPDLPKRFKDLASIARTPGLSGIMFQDTEPIGYEPTYDRTGAAMYPNWLAVLNELGYSESLRLGFLREFSVDPIDIADPWLYIDFDIAQPFFKDPNLGHGEDTPMASIMRDMPEKWFTYRADKNTKAIDSLIGLFDGIGVPILFAPRGHSLHQPPGSYLMAVPWITGQPLPSLSADAIGHPGTPDTITLFTFDEDTSLYAFRYLGIFIRDPKDKWARDTWAIDASSVKRDKLGPLLDRWFPGMTGRS